MKPIRVALSGSGFKFPAHVGALMAVRDAGYQVVELAGTSGGSIVAALAAAGMSLEEMRDLTLDRDWSDMLTWSPMSLTFKMGYCSGSTLQDFIDEQTGGRTFSELPVALTIVASDIVAARPYIFSIATTPGEQVSLAARASASIPFVYTPVPIGQALLMDGGMVNNIPIDQLIEDDIPRLGVQLVTKKKPLSDGVHTIFEIAPRLVELMLDANENTHVDLAQHQGARVAFVETGYANGLDRNMSRAVRQQLLDDGRNAVERALNSLQFAPT